MDLDLDPDLEANAMRMRMQPRFEFRNQGGLPLGLRGQSDSPISLGTTSSICMRTAGRGPRHLRKIITDVRML